MGNVVSDGRRHTSKELTSVPGNSARTHTNMGVKIKEDAGKQEDNQQLKFGE